MSLPTGVPGLDTVLGGGLEQGAVTVLAGAPGTGKTILAQQMCFAFAATGHRAVYYTTLSEPHSKLVRHLEPFSFFDADKLGTGVVMIHLGDLIRKAPTGGLDGVIDEVIREAMEGGPALVVIDSAKALRDFASERDLRMALYDLTSSLVHVDATSLLVGEYAREEINSGVEFSLADSIIELAYEPRVPIDRRWLRVTKMRGKQPMEGRHTVRITGTGVEVFPQLESHTAAEAPFLSTERITMGVPGLDDLMGGGVHAGEATMVLGPSGVGKTIFGLQFLIAGLTQGERCLYVTAEDTYPQLREMASGFGWDLDDCKANEQFVSYHVPIGELALDVVVSKMRAVLDQGGIRRVVIDSLAEMVAASRESDRFPAFARSLTGLVRNAGATLLITSETATLGPTLEATEKISFLFQNLLLLRYIEFNPAAGRALNIVKMRYSKHSKNIYEFDISEHGVTLKGNVAGVSGLLGWSALRGPPSW